MREKRANEAKRMKVACRGSAAQRRNGARCPQKVEPFPQQELQRKSTCHAKTSHGARAGVGLLKQAFVIGHRVGARHFASGRSRGFPNWSDERTSRCPQCCSRVARSCSDCKLGGGKGA